MNKQIYYKGIVRIMIYLMAVMIIVGAVLTIIMLFMKNSGATENIDVRIQGNSTRLESIYLNSINPGSKSEYLLNITADISGGYEVELFFDEIEDHGLKNHLLVSVIYDGVSIYDGDIVSLFNKDKRVAFQTVLKENTPTVLKVVYSVPRSVGNEAQGASLHFDITIRAETK